jgi:TonB family protein
MESDCLGDVYTLSDIARATDSTEAEVRAAAGSQPFWSHRDAVRIGRLLIARRYEAVSKADAPLFAFSARAANRLNAGLPVVISGSVHFGALAILFIVLSLAPTAATPVPVEQLNTSRLVFIAAPGPGGGGGGGGRREQKTPPQAELEGRRSIPSPVPRRAPPATAMSVSARREELPAEQLPALAAPIVSAPSDARDRVGLLEQAASQDDSRGGGIGGGIGSGSGAGIGPGSGAGIGPGTGGGTGGGPYRPGSGISPPRLLREVKADYTEEARRRSLTGEVLLEIVVRADGTVGDVKLLQGLGAGLNERAISAVRQWRFSPAERFGTAVDVVVEVGVEFRLR